MQTDAAEQSGSTAPQYASYPDDAELASASPRTPLPFIRSLTPTFRRAPATPDLPHSRFIPEAERGWVKRNLGSELSVPSADTVHSGTQTLPLGRSTQQNSGDSSAMNVDSDSGEARGYHWRPTADGKPREWVNFSHRNPTARQAFFDTHLGSSSFIRSFHQATFGWTERKLKSSSGSKDSPPRTPSPPASQEDLENEELAAEVQDVKQHSSSRWQELMHSWHALPSLSDLPLPLPLFNKDKQHNTNPPLTPELIPTVAFPLNAPDYIDNLEPSNVVMLGGYRGSVLRDSKTNQRMWIPIKVGVGIRSPTLEIGLTQEAETNSTDLVKASGMVLKVSRIADMGQRLQVKCSSRPGVQVHSFGYDWRLSLARSSTELESFLQQLYEESSPDPAKRKGAKVVAHSMGGLIALHALSCTENPRIFEALVFVSTPFLGTANILGPLRYGDAALYNRRICSPRATFSFRSSFYLLPPNGRCFEDQDGVAHNVDFLDPETWDDLGFSPCLERGGRRAGATSDTVAEERTDDGESYAGQSSTLAPIEAMQMSTSAPAAHSSSNRGSSVPHLVGSAAHALDGGGTLQPANQSSTPEPDAGHTPSEQRQAWAYLERTLSEVRRFRLDLELGLQQTHLDAGAYPPLCILASGTTPTVRGALVTNDKATADAWKADVRQGDYSRMLFAPGDGVVLRESATTLPGRWGELLVRDDETYVPQTRVGKKVLPASSIPGVVQSAHRHVTMLSDIIAVGNCLEACRRARLAREAARA